MTHGNRALQVGALLVTALGGIALDGTPAEANRRGKGWGGYGGDVVVVREPVYPARRVRDCDERVVRVREYVQPCPRPVQVREYVAPCPRPVPVRVVHRRDCGCNECVVVVSRSHRCDRYCSHW